MANKALIFCGFALLLVAGLLILIILRQEVPRRRGAGPPPPRRDPRRPIRCFEHRPSRGLAWSRKTYPKQYRHDNRRTAFLVRRALDEREEERFLDVAGRAYSGAAMDVLTFRPLARALGEDIPFVGVQPVGMDGAGTPHESVEETAAHYAAAIRTFHPDGPYLITLFQSEEFTVRFPEYRARWEALARRGVECHAIPGGHFGMLSEDRLATLAPRLRGCIQRSRKDA